MNLHQFPGSFGLPNASPFCMRVETFCRIAGIDYEVVDQPDPRSAPKKKLPVIDDGGKIVPDSGFIVDYLSKKHGVDLDEKLTPEQKALAHALTRMLCEHYYWVIVYYRFKHEPTWGVVREGFKNMMPAVIGGLVLKMVRKQTIKQCEQAGVGRHSEPEVAKIAEADIDSLAACLGDKQFFFGAEPTSFDATAFAFLANTLWGPGDPPIRGAAAKHQNLVAYTKRMRDKYFADMEAGKTS